LLRKNAPPAMVNGPHFKKPHDSEPATRVPINAQMKAEAYTPPAAKQTELIMVVKLAPSFGTDFVAYTNMNAGHPRN
jgi:hypothetical protein